MRLFSRGSRIFWRFAPGHGKFPGWLRWEAEQTFKVCYSWLFRSTFFFRPTFFFRLFISVEFFFFRSAYLGWLISVDFSSRKRFAASSLVATFKRDHYGSAAYDLVTIFKRLSPGPVPTSGGTFWKVSLFLISFHFCLSLLTFIHFFLFHFFRIFLCRNKKRKKPREMIFI